MESFEFVNNLLIRDSIFKYFFGASNLLALGCWLTTLVTNNYSQIDRLWSILPMVYSWCFVYTSLQYNENSSRALLMSSLITLWGVRLTYNYWRKGGYKQGEEDYRWTHVKKMFWYPQVKILFHLFNFVFIAFIQNWLLMSLSLPIWYVQTLNEYVPLNLCDFILTGMFLLFFAIEVIADEQQWSFQTRKKHFLKQSYSIDKFTPDEIDDFKRGFLTRGLFRYSRHPNFFGELSMWWTIYLFSLNNSDHSLINYSIFGAVVLQLIFLQSTPLTERISLSKYPKYSEYQSQVSRIIPSFSKLKFKKN